MSALLQRLKKSSVVPDVELLSESNFISSVAIKTQIPVLNIALGGSLTGGVESGLTIFAGPSRHFKTLFTLLLAKAYLDSDPEAIVIFYDSEFGASKKYFESVGIDPVRVLHVPIMNIEQLKFDCVKKLEEIARDEKVFFMVDSIGNLASKKELEDAMNEKSVADMTRAKQLKSFFRMVTPYLTLKDIPMVCVNHTYETQEMFSKTVMSGGTGPMYSADTVFIIGRRQGEKDGTELQGYSFVINVEKSRRVKEKSKVIVDVTWKDGVNKFTGLLDIALESGHVIKPKNGWYQRVDIETGEVSEKSYRKNDTNNEQFWKSILSSVSFNEFVKNKYEVSHNNLLQEEDNVSEFIEEQEES